MVQTLRKLDTASGWMLAADTRTMFSIVAAAALSVCLAYQLLAIPFYYSLDYGEAPLVGQAIRLASGQDIYGDDLSTPPYSKERSRLVCIRRSPLGTRATPVQAGQLLGYQGAWSRNPSWPRWVHVHLTVIRAQDEDEFPKEPAFEDILDPSPYLNLSLELPTENRNSQSLKCSQP